MSVTGKYIGLNQRIPFEVLDTAIYNFLQTGEVNRELILTHLQEYIKGTNRAQKACKFVMQIISRREKEIVQFKKSIGYSEYLQQRVEDRKAFLLCLISLTYPITYDLLVALASGFKVQGYINKQFINQRMAAIYGSNRTLDIAIDALMPMLIELNTIQRVRTSIYSLRTMANIKQPFISEFVVYTDIKLSGSKSILLEDLKHRPWYMYFDIDIRKNQKFKILKLVDSAVGQGYLTI